MRWSYRKSLKCVYIFVSKNKLNQNLVSFARSRLFGGLSTCGGLRRYVFHLHFVFALVWYSVSERLEVT